MPNQVDTWEEAQSKGSPVSHPGSDSHQPVPHDMDNLCYKVTQLDQWWLRCFPTFISRGEGRKEKRPCGKGEAPNTPCELRSPQSRHRTCMRSESTHHQIRRCGDGWCHKASQWGLMARIPPKAQHAVITPHS